MNVHPQRSGQQTQIPQIVTAKRHHPKQHQIMNPNRPLHGRTTLTVHASSTAMPHALSQSTARMHFSVNEDQALVLRRILVATAGKCIKGLWVTPVKSKHIVNIALDIEQPSIDHVIRAVITNMHSVELGRIIYAH